MSDRMPDADRDAKAKAGNVAGAAGKYLPPAARRALEEAAARRRAFAQEPETPKETGGRGGRDPARYGDWEIKGKAVDF